MKRIPLFYHTEEQVKELVLSTRTDKLGNIFHCVEYVDNNGKNEYAMFKNLSSALDFVQTNFK